MPTLTQPTVSADPLPPPDATLFYRRCADVLRAVDAEAAVRGLPPDPLAA